MDETKLRAIKGLVLFAVFWFHPPAGDAATITVDCPSASLQAAIDRARPGDILLVSGTCKENVTIPEETARVVLDGQGKATIDGPDTSKPTIVVRGRGITIKGLTVAGGRGRIRVNRGGQAIIDGNTVQGPPGGFGIDVGHHSYAVIVNNTIQNNPGNGIVIGGSSFAIIGFFETWDTVASPNT